MSLLRIYFSAQWRDASSPCLWALGDELGKIMQSGEAPLASLPEADDYLAVIAADRVTCVSVPAPSKARRRWEAALPFIAEEFSLSEPEQNHVVPGPSQPDGKRPLVIIDKTWLKNIIAACRAVKRPLRRAIPETFLPQLTDNAWTLVWDGNCGFMRTGEMSGLALDCGDERHAPLSLKLILKSASPQKIELRLASQSTGSLPDWNDLGVALTQGQPWDWRIVPIQKTTLNLLWGEFSPQIKIQEWLPILKVPLLVMIAALTLEAVANNVEWWRLASERRSLTQQMEQSFRSAFGESSVVVDPVLQMQRGLAGLHHVAGMPDESDFLTLIDASAGAFTVLPAGAVRAIHYESGRLDVDVHLANANDLTQLVQRLKRNRFSVRNGDIHHTADGIDIRLTLQMEGA